MKGVKYSCGVQMEGKIDTTLSMNGKQILRKFRPETLKVSQRLRDSEMGGTIVVKLFLNWII